MEVSSLSLKIQTEGMDSAQRGMDGLTNTAGMLESAFKKVVAVFALFKAGSFLSEITQLSARYDTLGVVMKVVGNNAGYTSAQMEAYAQSLQKSGISMVESRNTLSMMASAHIDLANAQKLGRIAQDAAVIGNINSSEAFQRMIYGIQSGQVEILRTIGINVNFEQSYAKLAQQLGKSAKDLTEVEKAQARTNAVMAKGKDIAGAYEESLGTVGKAAKSMERIWENLKVILGSVFQEGFTVLVNDLTAAMQTASDWARKYSDDLKDLGTALADVIRQSVEFTKLLTEIGGGSKGAADGVGFITRVFQGIALILSSITDGLRGFVAAAAKDIGWMVEAVGRVVDSLTTLGGLLGRGGFADWGRNMQAYGNNLASSLDKSTATGGLLDKWLNDQQKLVAKAEELKRKTEVLLAGPSNQAAGLMAAHSQDPREQARIAAGVVARYQQGLDAKKLQDAEIHKKLLEEQAKIFEKMGDDYNKTLMSASELLDVELKRLKIHDAMSVAIAHQLQEGAELAKLILKPRNQEDFQVGTSERFDIRDMIRDLGEADPIWKAFSDLEQQRLNLERWKEIVGPVRYTAQLALLRQEEMRLKAESGNTWAIIGYTVTQNAGRATDAMVSWMDNLDGVGRSWRTLGDTVRNVIADMLRQMERAIIQQKLMQPLMNWGMSALFGAGAGTAGTSAASGVGAMGSGASGVGSGLGSILSGGRASGGPVYGGSSYLVGEMGPEIFTPATSGNITPNHAIGSQVNNNVVVNVKVESNGQISSEASGKAGVDLAQRIARAEIHQWAMEQSRSNGLLAAGA